MSQFFFTQQDPNYRIQGSRDPLGFQVIWQRVGRKLIKYLSTVSFNIRDFQSLVYAHYFYGDRNPDGFVEFCLRFEQACAYARRIHIPEITEGFNGIDFVNKHADKEDFVFSLRPQDTILSNQKVYGLIGKYNRPSNEMNLWMNKDINLVMESALTKTSEVKVRNLATRIIENKEAHVTREELVPLADLLRRLTPEEVIYYRDNILMVPNEEHPQNDLYLHLKDNPSIISEAFNFHKFTNQILRLSNSQNLKKLVTEIQYTDKVLMPHLAIFRNLQSEASWTYNQIETNSFFNGHPGATTFSFSSDEELYGLNKTLNAPPLELISFLIDRNANISSKRKKAPWVAKEGKKIKIYYAEGARVYESLDTENKSEFDYFLATYFNLFKQIEKGL